MKTFAAQLALVAMRHGVEEVVVLHLPDHRSQAQHGAAEHLGEIVQFLGRDL